MGLLCVQYLGARADDPAMAEGKAYLLGNGPDPQMPNIYYWYYATQVMHNSLGQDWDRWNRQMRKILIDTQAQRRVRDGELGSQARCLGTARGTLDDHQPFGAHAGSLLSVSAVVSNQTGRPAGHPRREAVIGRAGDGLILRWLAGEMCPST